MISFRKCGNLKKQQTLKERLNKGIPTDLDTGEFSVHECASTLKSNYFFLNPENLFLKLKFQPSFLTCPSLFSPMPTITQ